MEASEPNEEWGFLNITLRAGDSIDVGGVWVLEVHRIRGNRAEIGIRAPKSINIKRLPSLTQSPRPPQPDAKRSPPGVPENGPGEPHPGSSYTALT